MLAKRKGVVARRGLKEAWSKPAARRTASGYEAVQIGRATMISRSPYPSTVWGVDPTGVQGRRSYLPREAWAVGKGVSARCAANAQESAEGEKGVVDARRPERSLRKRGGKWKDK